MNLFAMALSIAGGVALAFAFRASSEAKGLTPWYKWGFGTPVAFNRGLFWLGIAALVLGNVLTITPESSIEAPRPWVLWAEHDVGGYSAIDAFGNEKACKDEVAKRQGAVVRIVCLPETVDPRGPKGSGR